MMAAWRVAVILNAQMTGSGFNQLAANALAANRAVNGVNTSLLALKATALSTFAAMGGAMLVHGITAAADLQRAMLGVGIATSTAGTKLEALRRVVMTTSMVTAQDPGTIAGEMAMAARSGMNQPAMLAALFPRLAKFADVQMLLRGTDPVDAIRSGVSLAHMFKAWDEKRLSHMLDQVNRLMSVQNEPLDRIVAQAKYFVPMATNLHMSIDDIMAYTALMGQTGFLRGRGGSGMGRVLLGAINATAASAITSHAQALRYGALYQLGMIDAHRKPLYVDEKGELQFNALMAGLVGARSRLGAVTFGVDVNKVFGTVAEQLLMTIADPTVQKRRAAIVAAMAKQDDVDTQQAKAMNTFWGAWRRFITDFNAIATNVFYPTLPRLAAELGYVANDFATIANFIFDHPRLGLDIAYTAFATVGGASVAAASSIWLLTRSIWALAGSASAGGIASSARGLSSGVAGGAAGFLSRYAGYAGPIAAMGFGAYEWNRAIRGQFPNGIPNARGGSMMTGLHPIQVNLVVDGRKMAQTVVTHIARRTPSALRAGSGSVGHPRLSAASAGGSGFGWGN